MFNGEYEYSLDDKGRLIVPKPFRDALKPGLFATRGLEGCVWIFTAEAWEKFSESIESPLLSRKAARDLQRFIYSGARQELDSQWRLSVPPKLRRYADLNPGESVVVLGVKNRVELWNAERWDTRSTELIDSLGDQLDAELAQITV